MNPCKKCGGSGIEPDDVTDWFPASIKPVHKGVYQKLVNGYLRYAMFDGNEWHGWVESIKTVMYVWNSHPSISPDTVNPWRGLTTRPLA